MSGVPTLLRDKFLQIEEFAVEMEKTLAAEIKTAKSVAESGAYEAMKFYRPNAEEQSRDFLNKAAECAHWTHRVSAMEHLQNLLSSRINSIQAVCNSIPAETTA